MEKFFLGALACDFKLLLKSKLHPFEMAVIKKPVSYYKVAIGLFTFLQVVYVLVLAFNLYLLLSGQVTFDDQLRMYGTVIVMFGISTYMKWFFRTYLCQK
jgi:uncharacterized membrane protein